ncbi:BrnT family toxin [Endozoicomonas gorgoniicola]|uniref:BrnT family toxin n=1 Tax=Endozoicomonas gorgoniicola TaxID=1234144 RepID=A0ABT3MYN3_9GAMM|nr:BrnT family toxin [Endozoicomonas gorgoniicola]MCW7554492.1 BrnT family toxin [Endozoicomonas gorgoniicola]
MLFEYDPDKSRTNMDKHGIDFDEAQNLWLDESRVLLPAHVNGEKRVLMIATYKGKHWTAIYTLRGDKIRIISVRRSRTKEINYYEN